MGWVTSFIGRLRGGSDSARGIRGSVLVVDDDQSIRELFRLHLESIGFHVELAPSVDAARKLLMAKRRFRLFILDMRLPDGNGRELLREIRIKPEWMRTPAILVTAEFTPSQMHKATDGFENVVALNKPVSVHHLRKVVQEGLEKGFDAGG
jgi:DNA-binding response OmpR family regulator